MGSRIRTYTTAFGERYSTLKVFPHVPVEGVEPSRLAALVPKTSASANSATRACGNVRARTAISRFSAGRIHRVCYIANKKSPAFFAGLFLFLVHYFFIAYILVNSRPAILFR